MIRQWEKRVTVLESETQIFGSRPAAPPPAADPVVAPA